MKRVRSSTLVTELRDERRLWRVAGMGESETKFARLARREVVEASIVSASTAGEGGRGMFFVKDSDVRGVRGERAVEVAGWASESDLRPSVSIEHTILLYSAPPSERRRVLGFWRLTVRRWYPPSRPWSACVRAAVVCCRRRW